MTARTLEAQCRRRRRGLPGTLLLLTAALLSCGKEPAPSEPVPTATLRNPHAGDAAVVRNGALLFTAMNCDGCHGTGGSGWVGPNLGAGRWRYGGADAEVFSSIYYGRPRGMPAFGATLGAEGVWTLVTYLRTLAPPADLPTESWQN